MRYPCRNSLLTLGKLCVCQYRRRLYRVVLLTRIILNIRSGELVGGEDKIDTEREYLAGDNFIVNFGNERLKTVSTSSCIRFALAKLRHAHPQSLFLLAGLPTSGRNRMAYRQRLFPTLPRLVIERFDDHQLFYGYQASRWWDVYRRGWDREDRTDLVRSSGRVGPAFRLPFYSLP
jgi:hypothetical protein